MIVRKLIHKLGRLNTVIIITLLSVFISLAITFAVIYLVKPDINMTVTLVLSSVIPLLVAPLCSWPTMGLLFKIHRLEQEMRLLATYDFLTGLLNRRAFFHDAENYISLSKREKMTFSVLGIDLDKFKSINDKYGHPAGDEVLKAFAELIRTNFRKSDLLGRIGGEEFSIMLPNTTQSGAYEICKQLHNAIRECTVLYNDTPIKFTVSIGLVTYSPVSSTNIETILQQADEALYQAKEKGRNCTVIFGDTDI